MLHTMREPDEAMAAAGDAEMWRKMVEAAIAQTRRLSARRPRAAKQAAPTRAGRWSPASSPRACRSSTARCSTSRCPRSARATAPARQEVQWVVNAYLLPLSALLLLGGALGDHYGRRRLLVIGTEPVRASPRWSARSRRACRCCSRRARRRASARRCCCPTASRCSTPPFRARSAGARSASGPRPAPPPPPIAPLIGGWLVDNVGWPAIFYINLPLALGAILLALQVRR